jgi:hypothetical protein
VGVGVGVGVGDGAGEMMIVWSTLVFNSPSLAKKVTM